MILVLVAGLGLTACQGGAVIDFSFDPDQGVGNVVVNPASQGGDTQTTQILLFAMAWILLMAILIIVVALARRPRDY